MAFSVRRRRRPAAALFAFVLPVLGACEAPAEFTEPEEIAFTALAIDKATVLPREGARLTAGPNVYEVEVDVAWQDMPGGSELRVFLETQDSISGQTFRWEGDLDGATEAMNSATGSTTFEGTVVLPEVSPFCGSYDYFRILAVAFPGGDPPPNAAYRDEVFYEVSGSDWSGPCVSGVFYVMNPTNHRIGEPLLVYGRDLSDDVSVSLPGGQQADNVWPTFIRVPESQALIPVPNVGYMITFVPVGATSGRIRAFAGGQETRYSAGGTVTLQIATSNDDVFEPNNTPASATDSIYFQLIDPWGTWGVYGYNPSLTLSGADRTPDALTPIFGEGDWFRVVGAGTAATATDVCINVASHVGTADDLDLFVYDQGGNIAAQSATISGSEAVRLEDVSGSDAYWAWVTPYLAGFSSAAGGYSYEVGRCADTTGTDIARPDGPIGFLDKNLPASTSMRRPGGDR